MDDEPSDIRRFLLILIGAVWLMSFVYAFMAHSDTHFEWAPIVYLGWQGIAGMAAVALYGIGSAWEKGSAVRRLSRVPVVLALLHVIAISALLIFSEVVGTISN